MAVQKSITHLKKSVINLNIFRRQNFGRYIDRRVAKRLGRWATRLHIILFISGLTSLVLYTIVQSQTITHIIDKPSFNLYTLLKQDHGDRLKCTCSMIASRYNQFVEVRAVFHEVCTSSFASDQWRINLTSGLVSNLSVYEQRDYRRFLSAHLQFLQGLCKLSIESINTSVNQFLTSLFVKAQLASEKDFGTLLDSLIEQNKLSASITFERLFYLTRSINDGNAIVSTYGTNFEYISPWYSSSIESLYVPSQAIIYDDGCSCGLYRNCTTQASFTGTNLSEKIPLEGLKMGCTPSESFLASTLACFYNQSCINLIQQYTQSTSQINSTYAPTPLMLTKSRFSINATIAELVNNLFVEQWISAMNYSSYFKQCSPLFCSYVYSENFNLLYTITLLLGLQGGLTIALKWICPRIVLLVAKVCEHRRKRRILAQTTSSLEKISVETVNISIVSAAPTELIATDLPVSETNLPTTCSWYLTATLKCTLILFILIALVLFSIYIARLEKEGITSPMLALSTTTMTSTVLYTTITNVTTKMTTTANLAVCQTAFQLSTDYLVGSNAGTKVSVIADLNDDKILDVAFYSSITGSIHVLLGNRNGTFGIDMQSWIGYFSGPNSIITVADFDTDNRVDLAFVNDNFDNVYIMLGNGNATFRALTPIPMEYRSYSRDITTAHFNSDQNYDIGVANYGANNIAILLGNGDGTFQLMKTYYTGRNSYPTSIAVAHFNDDNYPDIVVCNFGARNIGIFLGRGDGTFDEQVTSFSGGYYYPSFISVGDFNSDHHIDVIYSYNAGNRIAVMFGYGNGTLGGLKKFVVGNFTKRPRVAVGDFNNDGHLDITVSPISPCSISVLHGYGDGNFQLQAVFPMGIIGQYTWVNVADFNADGFQDIITSGSTSDSLFVILNTAKCRTNATLETSTFIR